MSWEDVMVYAVIMPNIADTRYPWENYRRSIDDVEDVTGYDFFPDMPKVVQEVVEKRK